MALEVINPVVPETIGGSADLTGSNITKTKPRHADHAEPIRRPLHALRHPRARHGGGDERHGAARRLIPYGGTFLVFTDYARAGDPARRR